MQNQSERWYYHIQWSAFARDGREKEIPLAIGTGDERVVLLFDTFERAKEFMHDFLTAKRIVDKRDLQPNMVVVTIAHPVLGSPDPGYVFSPSTERVSADVHARAGRKSGVDYAIVNPPKANSLTAGYVKRARIPIAER